MQFNKQLSFIFIFSFCIGLSSLSGQGSYYGFQISPGFSTQKWNTSSRDALLTLNADVFTSLYGEDPSNIYYLKGGYHQRGSTINLTRFTTQSNFRLNYLFHNVLVGAGVKKMLSETFGFPFYYLLGVRVEYTVATNFNEINPEKSLFYPLDFFVNKFNYGVDFGSGFVFNLSDQYDLFLELMISPDFSLQYEQDPLSNVPNPFNTSQSIDIGRRFVRNLSFELAVGFRFNQEYEY